MPMAFSTKGSDMSGAFHRWCIHITPLLPLRRRQPRPINGKLYSVFLTLRFRARALGISIGLVGPLQIPAHLSHADFSEKWAKLVAAGRTRQQPFTKCLLQSTWRTAGCKQMPLLLAASLFCSAKHGQGLCCVTFLQQQCKRYLILQCFHCIQLKGDLIFNDQPLRCI